MTSLHTKQVLLLLNGLQFLSFCRLQPGGEDPVLLLPPDV